MELRQPRGGRIWLEGEKVEKYGQVDTSLGVGAQCDKVVDTHPFVTLL